MSKERYNEELLATAAEYQIGCEKNTLRLVGRRPTPVEAIVSEDAFSDGSDWGRNFLLKRLKEDMLDYDTESAIKRYIGDFLGKYK